MYDLNAKCHVSLLQTRRSKYKKKIQRKLPVARPSQEIQRSLWPPLAMQICILWYIIGRYCAFVRKPFCELSAPRRATDGFLVEREHFHVTLRFSRFDDISEKDGNATTFQAKVPVAKVNFLQRDQFKNVTVGDEK